MPKAARAPRRPPQTIVVHQAPELALDSEGEAEAADLEHVLAELGEGSASAVVKLWRIDPRDKAELYLGDMAPQEFSLRTVQEKFGGGSYQARVYVPQAPGSHLVKLAKNGNRRFAIDGLPKRPTEAPSSAAAIAAPASSSTDAVLIALARMQEQSEARMTKLIETIIARPAPAAHETLESTLRMLTLFKQSGIMGAPGPAVDPLALMHSTLTAAEKLAGLRGDRGDRDPDDDDDEPKNGIWGVAERIFTPIVKGLLEQQQANVSAAAHAEAMPDGATAPAGTLPAAQTIDGQATPVPATSSDATTETGGERVGVFDGDAMVKMAVSMAVSSAERNDPPGQYVDMVIDNAPGRLLDTLKESDWLERLATINPRVKLYPMWFQQLRDLVIAEIE